MSRPLRSRASFDALSASGRRRTGQSCWVRYAPTPADHDDVPYIGYAIGRSVGIAVVRNRIRRRLRAVLAEHRDVLEPGLYLIGVTHARTATMDFSILRQDLLATIERATAA